MAVSSRNNVIGMTAGSQTILSVVKTDERRLEKARQQVKDSSREARLVKAVAQAHVQVSDYQPGGFQRLCVTVRVRNLQQFLAGYSTVDIIYL